MNNDLGAKENRYSAIGICLSFISFVLGLVVLIKSYNSNNGSYIYLAVLPIIYSLVCMLCLSVFKEMFKKISITLIVCLYFIRMVLIPVFIIMLNYQNYSFTSAFSDSAVKTILLMSYEFLCVLFFYGIYLSKSKNKESAEVKSSSTKDDKQNEIIENFSIKNSVKILAFFLCIFAIIIYIKYPVVKNYTSFLFEKSSENRFVDYVEFRNIKSNVPSYIYWLYVTIYNILYIVMPFFIVLWIKNKRISTNIKMILSIIVIVGAICISTPQKANSFFMGISMLLILTYLYPKKKKILISTLAIGGTGVLFYALFLKSNLTSGNRSFIDVMEVYFSGPHSIAIGFKMSKAGSGLKLLLNDFLSSIAYMKYFFKDTITTTQLYNIAFYQGDYRYDKIIPMISQSNYYFGGILSPIISCLVAICSLKIDKKQENSIDIFRRYILFYTVILVSSSIIVYNFGILIANLTGTVLPVYLISRLNNKKGRRRKV